MRFNYARERIASHLPGWLKWFWSTRFGKNTILSTICWVAMYLIFLFEVSYLNWNSQHAKLSITPLGAPLGLTIQWLVFRDRLSVSQVEPGFCSWVRQVFFTFLHTAQRLSDRWWAVKASSFYLNQYAYALMLHEVGLPYMLAYPATASVLSVAYYKMNNTWVFVDKWWEGPVMSRLTYHTNYLWLTWTIGPTRMTTA